MLRGDELFEIVQMLKRDYQKHRWVSEGLDVIEGLLHKEYPKQKVFKPIFGTYLCPSCEGAVMSYDSYCPSCGVALVEGTDETD